VSRIESPDSPRKPARSGGHPIVHLVGAVINSILFLVAVPFLLLVGWGLVFNVPTLAVVAFTSAWILFPLFNNFKAVRVLKLGVSFVLVPATLALAPLMIQEVDQKVEQLSRKPRNDMSAFTLQDRLGIYGLNIVMGASGYPLYPEASKETLLMMLDPGPFTRRVFDSEFGLGSYKLRAAVREFAARLQRGDDAGSGG
jgi:hypothetical protein